MPDGNMTPEIEAAIDAAIDKAMNAAPKKEYATAFSVVVGLSDDRQATFQSGFESDEPDEAVNARLDRIMRLADRQKARYEIPALEEELAKAQETVANLQVDLERIDEQYERAQASKREQIAELDRLCEEALHDTREATNVEIVNIHQHKERIMQDGIKEHQRSGKLGSYVPRGARESDLKKCDDSLKRLGEMRDNQEQLVRTEYDRQKVVVEGEIQKAANEREVHRGNQTINLERWNNAIVEVTKKLARARSVLGG